MRNASRQEEAKLALTPRYAGVQVAPQAAKGKAEGEEDGQKAKKKS